MHRARRGCGAGAQPRAPLPCQGQRAGTTRHPPRTRVGCGTQGLAHNLSFWQGTGGYNKGSEPESRCLRGGGRQSRSTTGAPRQPREGRAAHKDPLPSPAPRRGGLQCTGERGHSTGSAEPSSCTADGPTRGQRCPQPGECCGAGGHPTLGPPWKGAPALPSASSALTGCPAGTLRGIADTRGGGTGTPPPTSAALTYRGSTPHHGARSW